MARAGGAVSPVPLGCETGGVRRQPTPPEPPEPGHQSHTLRSLLSPAQPEPAVPPGPSPVHWSHLHEPKDRGSEAETSPPRGHLEISTVHLHCQKVQVHHITSLPVMVSAQIRPHFSACHHFYILFFRKVTTRLTARELYALFEKNNFFFEAENPKSTQVLMQK